MFPRVRSLAPAMSFASVLLGLLTCTTALAQAPADTPSRVLVVRVGGETTLASALGTSLRESAFAATRTLGMMPLPSDAACEDLDCAGAFLSTGAADIALYVEVFGQVGVCEGVQATLLSDAGDRWVGTAEVGTAGVEEAMRVALGQAVARHRGEAMPTLGVNGTPAGATVRVDGATWGTVPHAEPIAPGPHVIEIRARGHRTERREVTLTGEDLTLDVALVHGDDGDAAAGGSSDATALWVSGGAALALGVASLVVGIVGFAMGQSCDDAACTTYSRPDAVSGGVWLGTGGALSIAGGVLLGVAASSGGSASGDQARLTLRATF